MNDWKMTDKTGSSYEHLELNDERNRSTDFASEAELDTDRIQPWNVLDWVG